MFRKIVRFFGPEWGAAVMGTAALSITLQLASEVARPFSVLLYIGLGFYLLTTIMFVLFLIPWLLRFIWFPDEIAKDLKNPVRANFFPTMPISFILAGTGTNKLGPILFGPTIAYNLAIVFFFVGAIGVFIFGFLLMRNQYLNTNLEIEHANFTWFIPPVSHLIIPVLGACSMDVHWAETGLAPWLFIISMIALGVGFFSFLFVGAAVWHRYIYSSVPEGRLAATTMVAIAPTAIIVIFLIKFAEAIEAAHGALFGLKFAAVFPVIQISSSILWGFSAWWLVFTAILFIHYISSSQHPVSFAWWAYTFPLEAFAVATGLLAKAVATQLLHPLLILLNVMAVAAWAIVVFSTLRWLQNGAYFEGDRRKSSLHPALIAVGLTIILFPFVAGTAIFQIMPSRHYSVSYDMQSQSNDSKKGIAQYNLELKWTFLPDWQYKPLLVKKDEYMVFIFHYTNHSDFVEHIAPSYSFSTPLGIRRPANEEIAAYIEDSVENETGFISQTPFSFSIPAHTTRHYIATFEKPRELAEFDVLIELSDNQGWLLHYENTGTGWVNPTNSLLRKTSCEWPRPKQRTTPTDQSTPSCRLAPERIVNPPVRLGNRLKGSSALM